VIVWLNGAFGVGKSTVARHLVARDPQLRLFDPEHVGYMLMANLADHAVGDFQHLPAWRRLVPLVANELASHTRQHLVAVQSVFDAAYWAELRAGMAAHDLDVVHVVLDADEATLRSRIAADDVERDAAQWRLDHIVAYRSACEWLFGDADLVIDTTALDPVDVAARVHDLVA
jgi:adenylylsulfate kinase-like enzyme